MTETSYAHYLTEVRRTHPDLAERMGGCRTLEQVLDWIRRDGHSFAALDMVTQDEFCHDLMMPLGSDWLVFGMT
jgi:hypothetical protein